MASRTIPTLQERLQRTSVAQRIGLAIGIVIVAAFIVLFFTFERQIFELLEPAVTYVRNSSAGMPVLASIMFATCIFPLFGYGVVSMICGYVYGIPKGFIPAFIGDVLGASAAFWLYRLALHGYIRRKFKDNLQFQEMSNAVSKDGLFILFLIRLSSFPFAVLNAYFGAMTQLPYWKFILATTLSTPRLFIPIFIGHNISSLSNPDIKGKDRILKWAGNVLGIVIALMVGWYIYRHTTRRIERINAGLSAEGNEMDCEGDVQEYQREHSSPYTPHSQQQQQQRYQYQYQHQYHQYSQAPPLYQEHHQPALEEHRDWTDGHDNPEDVAIATIVTVEEDRERLRTHGISSPTSSQSNSVDTIAVLVEGQESKSEQQIPTGQRDS